jgi:hypothetical protein
MKCTTFTTFKCRNEKLVTTAIPLPNTSYRSKRLKLFRKLHVKSRNYVKTKKNSWVKSLISTVMVL